MVAGWAILIYLALGGTPRFMPVYVSTEHFTVDDESGCKRRADEIHDKMRAYSVECVPVHESE